MKRVEPGCLVMPASVWLIILVILSELVFGQAAETVDVPPGMIVLSVERPGPDSDISWEVRDPIDLDYRLFEGNTLFCTHGDPGDRFVVVSDVIDWESRKRDKRTRIVRVAGDPKPDDDEDDPDDPDDDDEDEPTDAPFPAPGFSVLMLYEAQEVNKLPTSQQAIFSSPDLREWLASNCIKLTDSRPASRLWDNSLSDEEVKNAPPTMRNALPLVRSQANGRLPWIAISNGSSGYTGELPKTINETLELLKRFK